MSSTPSTGAAPSASSLLAPAEVRELIGPGTAMTARSASEGLGHGVHGPASLGGFDDDHHLRQSGDDAVAGGKPPALGSGAGGRLAEQQPLLRHLTPQRTISGRIHHVETGGHHADGWRTVGSQGAGVGRRVDAERQP